MSEASSAAPLSVDPRVAGRGPTRRALLAAAGWSVPTVLVAGAAPAFALSAPGSVSVASGATRVVPESVGPLTFHALSLESMSITVGPAPTPPLTVTVAFAPYPEWPEPTGEMVLVASPVGWLPSAATGGEDHPYWTTLTWTWSGALAEGDVVPFTGARVVANYAGEVGTFAVNVAAAGGTPAALSFPTPRPSGLARSLVASGPRSYGPAVEAARDSVR